MSAYKDAIVSIQARQHQGKAGVIRGTGALVGAGLVLTAAHVVADRKALLEGRVAGAFAEDIRISFRGLLKSVPATVIAGLFDAREDWVFLDCPEAPDVRPLPFGEVTEADRGKIGEAYGFPDLKPDGITLPTRLDDPFGEYEGGTPALQLYSDHAAAGDGAPVNGLSGAPFLLDGALVGVVRSALKRKLEVGNQLVDVAVAGTIFACPVHLLLDRTLDRLGDRVRLPDPCRGLPGLPRTPLPNEPFRGLSPYSEAHAELFFGRNRDIREIYRRLTNPGDDTVLLLYGQSGVGKSSIIDAGIVPRLRARYAVAYARRDKTEGLTATLHRAVGGDWRAREATEKRPLVVVLDQVEEAFTDPRPDLNGEANPDGEMAELASVLRLLFAPGAARPAGRLLLCFRKEWQPEIRAALVAADLPLSEHFLRRMDREGVAEMVRGVEGSQRLIDKYGTRVETGLAEQIAVTLTGDADSPIGPTLQFVMTHLHAAAKAKSPAQPTLTKELYATLYAQGVMLERFLRDGIVSLPTELRTHAKSGLINDLLEAHTTPRGTAATCLRADLDRRYRALGSETLTRLLVALEARYLISHPGEAGTADREATRLAHDTLAPLVRERYQASSLPGQQARRTLEARIGRGGAAPAPLDDHDLALVERGLSGMSAPSAAQQALIEASRIDQSRRRRNARIARFLAAGAVVLLIVFVVLLASFAVKLSYTGNDLRRRETLHLREIGRARLLDGNATAAAAFLVEAYAGGDDSPSLRLLLGLAMATTEARVAELPGVSLGLSGSGRRAAVSCTSDPWARTCEFDVAVFDTGSGEKLESYTRSARSGSGTARVGVGAMGPGDGQVAVGYDDGVLAVFDYSRSKEPKFFHGMARTLAWSPDGRLLAASDPIRLLDIETGEILLEDALGADTLQFSGDGLRLVAAGAGETHGTGIGAPSFRVWDVRTHERLAALDLPGLVTAAFDPKSNARVVTCGEGLDIRDVGTGRVLHHLDDRRCASARWPTPDTVISSVDSGAVLHHVETNLVYGFEGGLEMAPSRHIYAAMRGAELYVLAADGARVATLGPPSDDAYWRGAEFSRDGHVLATRTSRSTVIWNIDRLPVGVPIDLRKERVLAVGGTQPRRRVLVLEADGVHLRALSDPTSNDLAHHRTNTNVARPHITGYFLRDGELAITWTSDDAEGALRVWRSDDGELLREVVVLGRLDCIAMNRDSNTMVVRDGRNPYAPVDRDARIRVFQGDDARTIHLPPSSQHGTWYTCAVDSSGSHLLLDRWIVDVATGKPLSDIGPIDGACTQSPSGDLLAVSATSCSRDAAGSLRIRAFMPDKEGCRLDRLDFRCGSDWSGNQGSLTQFVGEGIVLTAEQAAVRAWTVRGDAAGQIDLPGRVTGMMARSSGLVAVGANRGWRRQNPSVSLWDVHRGDVLARWESEWSNMPRRGPTPDPHVMQLAEDGSDIIYNNGWGLLMYWRLPVESRSSEAVKRMVRCRVPLALAGTGTLWRMPPKCAE